MLDIILSNRFRKDLKLTKKRGYDLALLDDIVTSLAEQKPLPPKNRDHELSGNYEGFRECHIQPLSDSIQHITLQAFNRVV